jgi:predicted double-glycine peptidase
MEYYFATIRDHVIHIEIEQPPNGGDVLFTTFWLQTITQSELAFDRWVERNEYRIIHKEIARSPFTKSWDVMIYRITVEDREGNRKSGRLRLGNWHFVVFVENIEVQWDE